MAFLVQDNGSCSNEKGPRTLQKEKKENKSHKVLSTYWGHALLEQVSLSYSNAKSTRAACSYELFFIVYCSTWSTWYIVYMWISTFYLHQFVLTSCRFRIFKPFVFQIFERIPGTFSNYLAWSAPQTPDEQYLCSRSFIPDSPYSVEPQGILFRLETWSNYPRREVLENIIYFFCWLFCCPEYQTPIREGFFFYASPSDDNKPSPSSLYIPSIINYPSMSRTLKCMCIVCCPGVRYSVWYWVNVKYDLHNWKTEVPCKLKRL
jgi:hypothetical protein